MKGKTVVIILLVLLGVCVLCAGGGFLAWNFWLKNTVNIPGVTTTSDGTVSINVGDESLEFNDSDSKSWPSDMPSVLPKFDKGNITSTGKMKITTTTWTVTVNGVEKSDFLNYSKTLESKGWEMNTGEYDDLSSYTGTITGYTLNMTYDNEKKEMIIILTVAEEE